MPESASSRPLVLERPRRLALRELPMLVIGDDAAEDLLATMAGERDGVPTVHGVVMP